ncbi:MAG: hypothetical protein P8J59_05480 [Phycisphaerales bacterium]|nr:hypothetical protein [Phycisphaerales bacterium]
MSPSANPMGQVYLGFRSLLVKLAVFVVMAALLAWAIGGTLWPRTAVGIVGTPIVVDGSRIALISQIGGEYSVLGLGVLDQDGSVVDRWPKAELVIPIWRDALTPVSNPGGSSGAVAYRIGTKWFVREFKGVDDEGQHPLRRGGNPVREVANRLEAARILEEFASGLPVASSGGGQDQSDAADTSEAGSSAAASSGPN